MQIDKSQLLELLRSQGQHEQADSAEQNLPDQVDTEEHGAALAGSGIDIQQIISLVAGGGAGGLGGLAGGLGGLLGGGR